MSGKEESAEAGQRKEARHHVQWRVAVVFENNGKNEIFHGRTHDLSTQGASIYSERNIFIEEPVKVLLSIPSLSTNRSEKVIEISSRMVYTVLASDHHQFRIGLHFLRFNEGGHNILTTTLLSRGVPFQ